MLISHKGHTVTIQVYSVTVMTHVKALQAGHSSQGTSEPITPGYRQRRWRAIGNGAAGLSAAAVPGYRQRRMHLGPVYKGAQAYQRRLVCDQ